MIGHHPAAARKLFPGPGLQTRDSARVLAEHLLTADDSRQRTLTGHLNLFYDAVIASVRNAESILIFGPGEAKDALKGRLEGARLGGRVIGIETVDKMTKPQIAATVRQHFAN